MPVASSQISNLIQPIRDLAKNWEVDVASRLEEYLSELEDVRITFDGGRTTMNFAEAALLIQSSTCIYSRKVEYLYSLVFQALDMISSKRMLQSGPSVDGAGNDNDISHKEEERFMLLNDVRQNKHVNAEDPNDTDENFNLIVKTPMAFTSVDESEKTDKALISQNAEALGSKVDYWMNRSLKDLSGSMTVALTSSSKSKISIMLGSMAVQGLIDMTDVLKGQAEPTDADIEMPVQNDVFNEDEGPELFDAPPSPETPPRNEDIPVVEEKRYGLRDTRPAEKLLPVKPVQDPWQMLDPHSAEPSFEKVFKKATTFRIPKKPKKKKVPTATLR